MLIDVTRTTAVSGSGRARQLSAMFDVPGNPHQSQRWRFDAPLHEKPWQIGLIVGPSGAGKSTILTEYFGTPKVHQWESPGVIDDFDFKYSMHEIAAVCSAVGFNTIPAWLRPYRVLSNGERFRAGLARTLLASDDGEMIVLDEFTSVVDRQVAQIGAHAVQKWVRANNRRLVAASCHYDIIDWLQPDWVIEAAEQRFTWRSVQPRPRRQITIAACAYAAWRLFAAFHYLTNKLHASARCYAVYIDARPVAFAGVIPRPHATARDIWGVSRLVTLPDWQGLGLAFTLVDALGAAYAAAGWRLRTYPAHPGLVRSFDRSPSWRMTKKPGYLSQKVSERSGIPWMDGSRPCAVFEYDGKALGRHDAARLLLPNHPYLRL